MAFFILWLRAIFSHRLPMVIPVSIKMSIMTDTKSYSLAFLLLRLAFGFRLVYGTIDNVLSWEQMLEFRQFLESNGFPFPLLSAIISVYAQFLSGISWMIGYKVKFTAALMVLNFIVAIVGVHLLHGDSYLGTAPAIHLLVVAVFLFLCGPGEWSLDKKLSSRV